MHMSAPHVEVSQRVMRVFVSSTFRDMHAERDELVKRVFPQLRKMCEERDVVWSEVDLRWGVTDEQVAEGRVLPICLAEIEHCRPYFIGLLGERYGWVPEAYPQSIVLQEPWLDRHHGRSVTELEILHGVLNDPAMHSQAYFYFRDPAHLESLSADERSVFEERPTAEEIAKLGHAAAEQHCVERRSRLNDLKERIRQSGLPVQENYRDPLHLGECVQRDLTSLIERLFPANRRPDPLRQEQFEQSAFVRSRSRVFVGRNECTLRLQRHVMEESPPLVVEGEAGLGKTALLASFVSAAGPKALHHDEASLWSRMKRVFSSWRDETIWIYHFVDASASSANWKDLVEKILKTLRLKCSVRRKLPDSFEDQIAALQDWLPVAVKRKKIVLVLDGIDQLNDEDRARSLVWLPATLSPRVRLICSTRPGRTCNEMAQRGWQILKLQPLTANERTEFITAYLQVFGKVLAMAPRDQLAAAPQTGNPLYLSTILEELRLFGEHEKLTQRIQHYLETQSVEELYIKVLQRYEEDYESERPGLVRDAMSLLWGTRHGLPEFEFLELLGTHGEPLPRRTWSPMHLAARQSMINGSGMLKPGNDHLRRAIVRRYLERPAQRHDTHRKLADYFGEQDPNRRRIEDLLWQLIQMGTRAEDKKKLAEKLCDLRLLSVAAEQVPNWMQEWTKGWNAVGDMQRAVEGYARAADLLVADAPDQPATVRAIHAASSLLHSLGYSAAAEQLLLVISKLGATGEKDPDAEITLLERRGYVLQMQNKFDDAIACFQQGAEESTRRFGKGSYEEATFLGALAGVYHQQGRDEEALPLYERALESIRRHIADDSRNVLVLRSNLALTYTSLSRYDNARQLYMENLRIEEQQYGRDSPEVVALLLGLASIEIKLGRFEQAIQIEERALAIREAALGPDHPKTLNVVHNLATTLGEMKQPAKAVPLYERCLEGTRRIHGEDHTDYATTLSSLGEAYSRLGQYGKALPLLERAIEIFDRVAPGHPDRNITRLYLASMHISAGQFAEGRKEMEEVVAWNLAKLGPTNHETARTLRTLAVACWRCGDLADAERYFQQARDSIGQVLGEHPEHLKLLLELEQLLKTRGDDAAASDLHRQAEEMASRLGLSISSTSTAGTPVLTNASNPTEAPPVDQAAIDRARQRVQLLFGQAVAVARSNPEPAVFFRAWLSRAVEALEAYGGAVWAVDPLGNLRVEAEWQLPIECQPQHVDVARHHHLLRRVAKTSRTLFLFPGNRVDDAPDLVNPFLYALVLVPMKVNDEAFVVELVQRPNVSQESSRGMAQFLVELCRLAAGYLQHRYADDNARTSD